MRELYPFRLKRQNFSAEDSENHCGQREKREQRELRAKYAIFFVSFAPLILPSLPQKNSSRLKMTRRPRWQKSLCPLLLCG